MATAATAMMFSQARSGSLSGLMAAPCTPPNTEHWFVGVGASADYRTELVLTNPDDGQAEVDLRFYGRNGIVVVPGSPGLIIDGRTSRTVSLQSLVEVEGPLTVSVRASEGRVSAMALDRRSAGTQPQGADWQSSSVSPTATMIIPGVPEGAGARELVVANPGPDRAEVGVEVLGIEGAFAPIGAETLVVPPESTASVGLTGGLAGQSGSIRLTSTQPVTAAVHAVSSVQGARPDLSVQPAVAPLSRTGVVALASIEGVDAEFVLSNGGAEEAQLSFEVLSYEGVRLRTDDVTLIGGGTSSRRITSPAPAYLVVRAPPDAAIFGSVELPLVHRERGGSGQCAGHLTGSGRSRAPGGVRPGARTVADGSTLEPTSHRAARLSSAFGCGIRISSVGTESRAGVRRRLPGVGVFPVRRRRGKQRPATDWSMLRGEIRLIDLEPARGNEANKRRPAVIVSNDRANVAADRLGRGVITVVPVTSNVARVFPFQTLLSSRSTGLRIDSQSMLGRLRPDRGSAGTGAVRGDG